MGSWHPCSWPSVVPVLLTVFVVCPQRKATEVRSQKGHLKKIEDLGAAMEERLILDNR